MTTTKWFQVLLIIFIVGILISGYHIGREFRKITVFTDQETGKKYLQLNGRSEKFYEKD